MNDPTLNTREDILRKHTSEPLLSAAAIIGFVGTLKSLFTDTYLIFQRYRFIEFNNPNIVLYATVGFAHIVILVAQFYIMKSIISLQRDNTDRDRIATVLSRISTAFGVMLITQIAYISVFFIDRIDSLNDLIIWLVGIILGSVFSVFLWKSANSLIKYPAVGYKPQSDMFLIVCLLLKLVIGLVLFGIAVYYFATFFIKSFFYILFYLLNSSNEPSLEPALYALHTFGCSTSYISYFLYLLFLLALRKDKADLSKRFGTTEVL